MPSVVFSSKQSDYASFINETLDQLEDYNVKGLAVVALTENDDLTAYWHMSVRDKAIAESAIRYDAIDSVILANRDRYGMDGGEE